MLDMFIAFEGPDGAGSSTHSRLLAQKLKADGYSVVLTKEPTEDTETGRLIRRALRHELKCSPEGLQLLFCADRAEHLKNIIEPALKENKIVITDRYFFSTIAYGALEIDDIGWLNSLNKKFREPDITFLLKADPDVCMERICGRGGSMELFEKRGKLMTVSKNYMKIAKNHPDFYIIDTSKSKDETSDEIWNILRTLLK